jgi:hypothetical protein
MPSVAVHVLMLAPHPGVSVTDDISLLIKLTASGPVPDRVKTTGANGAPVVTLWLAPEEIETVGAGGFVTVTEAWYVAVRLAPSVAVTCTDVEPDCPIAGVRMTVHCDAPQERLTPVASAGMMLAGRTETLIDPVPVVLMGSAPELFPPTTEAVVNPEIVGEGIAFNAPTASTRP